MFLPAASTDLSVPERSVCRSTCDAVDGLQPEVCSRRSSKDQGDVRIRDGVLNIISPHDAYLQRRRRRIRLEGGDVSISRHQADCAVQLKAHFWWGDAVC